MKTVNRRLAALTIGAALAAAMGGCAAPGTGGRGAVTWPSTIVHLHSSGKAFLIDAASDQVTATLETFPGANLGSTTPDGRYVYVGAEAVKQNTVSVIDLHSRSIVAKIETGNRPKHPLVSPDGRWVMINHWGLDNGKLRVSFIDTATRKLARNVEIDVSTDPGLTRVTSMHNSWSIDSRYAFTVDRVDNHLLVIDVRDFSVRKFRTPSAPHYPVPSPDGRELWLVIEGRDTTERPAVLIYDLTRAEMPVKARLDMPLQDQTAIEGHHGNFTQDGRYFFVLNRGPGSNLVGNEVVVFETASRRQVARFATKSTGIGHAYNTPDGRHAVITNYGNNVISVVDVKDFRESKSLAIGKGRMGHIAFTRDGRFGYVSNAGDGNLYKIDTATWQVVREIQTGNAPGGAQVLTVWTNVFEELPR